MPQGTMHWRKSVKDSAEELPHEEIAGLLPWYVNGTLDPDDLHAVEKHLPACRHCRDDVEMYRALARSLEKTDAEIPLPEPDVDTLLASLEAEALPPGDIGRFEIGRFFSAAAAALAGAVIVATLLAYVELYGEGSRYETVSSGVDHGPTIYELEVRFSPSVLPDDRRLLLAGLEPIQTTGPDADGAYRIHVELRDATLAGFEAYTDRIAATEEIASVRIIGVSPRKE